MSKEEGEITDDDDVDCSTSEEAGNRYYGSRRQLHYCYNNQDYSERRVISRLEDGLSSEKGSNFPSRHRGESSSFRKHGASNIHDSRQRFTAGSARAGNEVSQMCLPSSSRGDYSRSLQYSNYERPEDGGYKNYRSYKDRQDQQQFSIISDRSVSDSAKSWRRRKFCPSYSAGDGFHDNDGPTSSRQNDEQSNPANPYELLVREYQRVREKLDAYEYESEGGESPVSQHHLQAARAKSRDRKIGHSISLKSSRDSECCLSLDAFDGSSIGVTRPGRSQQNGSKSVAEVATTTHFSAEVSVQAVDSSIAIPVAVDVKVEIVDSGRDTGDDFGGVKTDDGGVAASPTSVVEDSGTSECRTSLLFQQSVLDTAASNAESLDADEEEELDELELRRIALESAARRMACDDDTDVTVLSSSSVDLIQAEESVIGQPGSKDKTSATLCSCDTSSQAKPLPSKSPSLSLGAVARDRQLAQRQTQDTFHSQRLQTRSGKALPARTPEHDRKSGHGSSSAKGSGSKRTSAKQQGITNNISLRSAREKSVPPRRNRPLPFAPTRLDKITVKATRGNSGRSSETSSQAQKKARHVSVVRKVSRTPKTSSKSLEKHASNKPPAQSPAKNQRRYGDKDKEEKRRQEIAKILSLEDPKEQVDRFLRFLNVTIAENSQGKQQQLRDNYEEVEMDIDSGDEGGLRMGELPAALQPLRLMGADMADFQCPADLLQGLGQWMVPFPYMDSYSGMMHFPSILHSAPQHPAMPAVPLPALPQAAPSQPPLPEDVPQPPPPPPPESLIEGKDLITDSDSGGFSNRIDTRASFMLGEVQRRADQASARHAAGGKAGSQGCDDAGPLPDKSGYTLAIDEGSPKSEAKASADEEEEVELRKQLLEDLIKRKEQAESKRPESGGSSPAKFDAVSPLCLFRPRDMPHKAQISSRRYLLPMHKPVVVPLCNSSSEDEGEDLKNMASVQRNKRDVTDFDIDSFLKVQRKTVEEQKLGSPVKDQKIKSAAALPNKALYPEQHQHLQKQEAELAKLRQLIMKDQAHVQEVMARGNRILAEQKRAEAVVKRLQEQLLAALKLVTNKSALVERAKTQFRQARERLVQKQDLYKHMEEKTMSLGQKLLGADYRPRIALPSSGIKRKVEVAGKHQGISITVVGKDTKKRKVEGKEGNTSEKENIISTAVAASSTAEKRAAEKAHLQNLAKEYEEKIRHLKMLQMQRNLSGLPPGAANTKNTQPLTKQAAGLVISLPNSKNARLASLESIKLEPVDSDSVVQKFRRRSLLDMEQSPKPNLLLKEHHSAKKPDTASEANSPVSKKKSVPAKFRMPSGVQLKNLCKIQKEKVSKILSSQSCTAPEVFSNLSPHCDPISELNIIYLQEQKRQEKRDLANLAYTSPLLHFKAYRFSPYYRTKESLVIPSASFSNKFNPSRILCRYELQGICNDQQCPWQHARDYRLTEKELLQDLVAYCPKLAGIVDSDDQNSIAKKIDAYVESLLAQHKGKMTFDDICLLLTSKVNECAEHVRPHTMFFESRLWHPNIEEARSFSMSISSDFQTPLNITGETTAKPEMDAVLDSEDVRYFVPDSEAGGDVQDMEGAVLSTPEDTDLWLRLAYSKLSNPSRSKEESLNQALNVLSRGLESNKESSDLWTHYLNLYRCHGDASIDFVDVCNTALEYAACYEIWWQLLEASMGFQAKDSACNKALNFLCKKEEGCLLQSDTKDEVRSHQILEMILYKVTLNSQSGRFKTAVNFFQSVVGVREGVHGEGRYRQHLTHPDTCVLWVCLVHLMEFQTLPAALYDPANQNPGRIMSKKGLWIPWHSKRELTTVFDTVVLYLSQAVTPVDSAPLPCYTSPQYVQAVLNLTQLLCYRNKYMEACEVLKRVLEWAPHLEDLWLMSADIYAGVDDMDSARQVILESVASNKYSAKLHYHLAMLELLQNCGDEALELMERFVISHFSVSDEDMTKVDPNFLFCKILGLDVPVMKKLPSLQDDVKESLSSRDVHLWLCYCLLLELQGETSEAVDVFEHALSSTIDAADLCLLWKSYVQFLYRRLHSCPPGLVPATLQQIQEAMLRSVTTAPTLLPTPGPSRRQPQRQLWRDFSHVTSLVDFYVQLVPADAQATALQTFLDLMPANVALLIRCVEAAVKDGQRRRARSLCTTAVYDRVANLHLWKLALSLAQEEGTPREVERLYVRAVRAMPLSVSLWKDFLLYEVSQENSTAVQSILSQCQALGLNIQGYVATISSSSSAS